MQPLPCEAGEDDSLYMECPHCNVVAVSRTNWEGIIINIVVVVVHVVVVIVGESSSSSIIIIIIINEEIIVAFSPRTTRTRYKVKKQNHEIRCV